MVSSCQFISYVPVGHFQLFHVFHEMIVRFLSTFKFLYLIANLNENNDDHHNGDDHKDTSTDYLHCFFKNRISFFRLILSNVVIFKQLRVNIVLRKTWFISMVWKLNDPSSWCTGVWNQNLLFLTLCIIITPRFDGCTLLRCLS